MTSGSFLMIHSPIDRRIPPIQEDTKTPVMKMKIWGTKMVFGQMSMEFNMPVAILASSGLRYNMYKQGGVWV